jgi:SAM-dependent methyltransferase
MKDEGGSMTSPAPGGAQNAPDFAAITGRQQQVWATGDFNVIAMSVIAASEQLVEAVNPRPGQRVLDVACGSGNVALIAARRYCDVTGIDYVPDLLARARQRAAADGVSVDFRQGDAQALPVDDGSYDVVLSVFGVMFAPDQPKAAAELLRACRAGGTIGLVAWMPEGWGGEFFRAVSKHLPPPVAGMKPPVRWGSEEGVRELLGSGVAALACTRRDFMQHYRSIDHGLDMFFSYYGPTARPYQAADAPAREAFRRDIAEVFRKYNEASDGTCALRSEYLQVIATRA